MYNNLAIKLRMETKDSSDKSVVSLAMSTFMTSALLFLHREFTTEFVDSNLNKTTELTNILDQTSNLLSLCRRSDTREEGSDKASVEDRQNPL
jgi:hypothetical protein